MRCTNFIFCFIYLGLAYQVAPSLAQEAMQSSVAQKIAGRSQPSIFQAWNPADNLSSESTETTESRHDLLFHDAGYFWLHWNNRFQGLANDFTTDSLANAKQRRSRLIAKNPNLVLLCEIRYRDAHTSYLPENHAWWLRDETGERVVGWKEGNYFLLDYHNPDYRKKIVQQAAAAFRSEIFDGVMLDWWKEDDSRVLLVKELREALGSQALILVNSNDLKTPRSAQYINGLFMECYRSNSVADWKRITETLIWAEENLQAPRINCLETWFDKSRNDFQKMRATTTLMLTHSDGYALFSDPNDLETADHLHNWYEFWNASLGKPLSESRQKFGEASIRRFEKGVAVFNPRGADSVTIELESDYRSQSTGQKKRIFTIAAGDGDILLRRETKN